MGASQNPVVGKNLAYTVHFYAASHGQYLRDKVSRALANGVPVFATEWGTCEATGNGRLDFAEVKKWLAFFEQNHISDANWAISDKTEACSALAKGASGKGGWDLNQLTTSGKFVRKSLRASLPVLDMTTLTPGPNPTTQTSRSTQSPWSVSTKAPEILSTSKTTAKETTSKPSPKHCSDFGDDCTNTHCCNKPGMQCYQKNNWWASCKNECVPGIDPAEAEQYQTPWTCSALGSRS